MQGTSYHLILKPVVDSPVTIVVPGNEGTTTEDSTTGVVAGDVNLSWWTARLRPGRRHRLHHGHEHLRAGPTSNGIQVAEGYYHRGGRYTFMGDLNPYPGFRSPATGC